MKVIAVLLTISMLLFICGCKADLIDAAPTEAPPTEVVPTETEPTEAEPTEAEPTEAEPTEAEPTEAEPTEAEPTEAVPPPATESSADPETYVSQLLTDINYNGKVQPGTEVVPPGTLPDVSRIPCADQTLVGSTVKINLGAGQAKGSYLYRVDSQNNQELLAVVIHAVPEKTNNFYYIPLLAVFEVELGGLQGLCSAISNQESFSATVLSLTNISFEEGMYTQTSATAANIPTAEVIDLTVGAQAAPDGWYIGSYGEDGSTVCYGGSKDTVSQQTSKDFAVFERVFARFSIAF